LPLLELLLEPLLLELDLPPVFAMINYPPKDYVSKMDTATPLPIPYP
jgi:hypothetical protein